MQACSLVAPAAAPISPVVISVARIASRRWVRPGRPCRTGRIWRAPTTPAAALARMCELPPEAWRGPVGHDPSCCLLSAQIAGAKPPAHVSEEVEHGGPHCASSSKKNCSSGPSARSASHPDHRGERRQVADRRPSCLLLTLAGTSSDVTASLSPSTPLACRAQPAPV